MVRLGIAAVLLSVFLLGGSPADNHKSEVVADLKSSHSRPREVLKNFENAQIQKVCARKEPTAVHVRGYRGIELEWIVTIWGRNGADMILEVIFFEGGNISKVGKSYGYVKIGNEWKNVTELPNEECGKLPSLNQEEFYYFNECITPLLLGTSS